MIREDNCRLSEDGGGVEIGTKMVERHSDGRMHWCRRRGGDGVEAEHNVCYISRIERHTMSFETTCMEYDVTRIVLLQFNVWPESSEYR